jgi:acetyl-CoA acetyltransferase
MLPVLAAISGAALSQETARTCLEREMEAFFTKLASAIIESSVDAAKVDDVFIGQGAESIIRACSAAGQAPSPAEAEGLRTTMKKWVSLLDRKLSDIRRTGGAD